MDREAWKAIIIKKVRILTLAIALLAVGFAGCSASGEGGTSTDSTAVPNHTVQPVLGVQWFRDWDEATTKAQVNNKVIMINFYTDVCPACRKLDNYTFADEEVSVFINDKFVPMKSNAGKTILHRNYGIRGVPTTVFTEPDGKEIGRIVGYVPSDKFRDGALKALDLWQE